MSGILFFGTQALERLKRFYLDEIGCQVWLDQGDCIILRHGNLLLGFCERDRVEAAGVITFFYGTKREVDQIYDALKTIAVSPPSMNDKYRIYQFFAHDPEGRKLEFQCFDHTVDRYLSGDELLLSRRSIRDYKTTAIVEAVLDQVLDISRFAPTSRNSQSYYFKVIKDQSLIRWLSEVRGKSSAPIGRAPLAIAICADPELSKRYVQDGCIAAYHLMLTASFLGLGSCWIAAMDREDVKARLEIPEHHYVATVTPLGYPRDIPHKPPERKELSWFVRD